MDGRGRTEDGAGRRRHADDYDYPDAERVAESARDAVPVIAGLIDRARDGEATLVFVNDNYGDWGALPVRGSPTTPSAALTRSWSSRCFRTESDPFIVKARHSAFYTTPLEYMVRQEEVERVVLAGQVTEQCVLYSALDAYVRHFSVAVVRDGVAHIDPDLAEAGLTMIERNMKGDVRTADEGILRPG